MSHETRLRVIGLWKLKYRLKDIQAKLQEEEIRVSKKSLCLLIRKVKSRRLFAIHQVLKMPTQLECYLVSDHYLLPKKATVVLQSVCDTCYIEVRHKLLHQ